MSMRIAAWLPNSISALRIALVPFWLVLAFEARHAALSGLNPSPIGLILVSIAIELSDILDGVLARRFGLATNLGAMLDAVADKIAQLSCVTFLALAGAPAFTELPIWLMICLVTRDITLTVGWWVVHRKVGKVNVEHQWHGKVSSRLLSILILAALAKVASPIILVGSVLVLLFMIPSTLMYLLNGWRQLTLSNTSKKANNTNP